jgi:hypothetical protein
VQSIRRTVVVEASVLITAVRAAVPWAVDRVLSDGFVDADVRSISSCTPLMKFAIWWGTTTV